MPVFANLEGIYHETPPRSAKYREWGNRDGEELINLSETRILLFPSAN
jgi:hypothetical protein